MVNLVVDQGNTRTKVAAFRSNKILACVTLENDLASEAILKLYKKHMPKIAILSSVSSNKSVIHCLQNLPLKLVELTEHTALPFKNKYQSRTTLGKDRIAAIAGAFAQHPNRNCLVIDAGTAITYDIITNEGEYLGGSISPGLQMRFTALNSFTSKLPLVEVNPDLHAIGTDTYSSINSGVYFGILHEMDGFISYYKKRYQNLFVFLTGGDALIFEKNIKNSIFVAQSLVLSGLNSLLVNHHVE